MASNTTKNNPQARNKLRGFFINEEEIKPVKYISTSRSFMAAEYDKSGELVKKNGEVLTWFAAKNLCK